MSESDSLASEIAEILGKILGEEVDPSNLGAHLADDYGTGSMDVVDFVERLERNFPITIPNRDIESFVTFGDVLTYVATRLSPKP